jgi:hypothetical protein
VTRLWLSLMLAGALGAGKHEEVRLEAPQSGRPALFSRISESTSAAPRAVAAGSWWGGTYTAGTGEPVRISVSASYPRDEAVAQRWAEFFAGLVHGEELARVKVFVAPPAEVTELCGSPEAAGCYSNETLVTVGDSSAGVAPELVAAHEYGHHVANSSVNPPWRAIDWGPKRWASAAGICTRAASGAVFPGDEGINYRLNPGEAFAETYRVLNERRAGATGFLWPVVDASLFPDDRALAAAEDDVRRPWAAATTGTARGRLTAGRRRDWSLPLATPLDGELEVKLRMAADATHELSLVDERGARLARGLWAKAGEKTLRHTVCGERSLRLRVAGTGPSRFTIRWSRP